MKGKNPLKMPFIKKDDNIYIVDGDGNTIQVADKEENSENIKD